MTETPRNTPLSTPQDETTDVTQELITDNTGASLEKSLSEVPLTPDQKIEILTSEVRNLTNGLNQLLELSKILVKGQIESSNEMGAFIQSMGKITQSTNTKLIATEEHLHTEITNAVKEIVDVQEQSNKKIISNQKKLAQGVTVLLENSEILGQAYYGKQYAIEELDTIGK